MRIIFLTYVHNPTYRTAEEWFDRIRPSLPIMEQMASMAEVINIHSIGYSGTEVLNRVTHYFFEYSRLQLLFPFSLHQHVKRLRPDAIIVRGLIFPLQLIMLRLKLGKHVKIVVQHHAERPLRWPKSELQRLADRFIGFYFFASYELAKPWVLRGQIDDQKKIIEALVISSVFFPSDRLLARQITQVVGWPAYLWVGGFDHNKDPITLISAFREFAKKQPKARLYFIYQTEELLEEVKNATEGCKEIILVGKVRHEHLQSWFNSVDFIVSTSHYEGSGIAICEGISCGCIPILSDIPSFHWMTRGGEVGLQFKPGHPAELCQVLQKSLLINIALEREKVLNLFREHLAAEVNARRILNTIISLK